MVQSRTNTRHQYWSFGQWHNCIHKINTLSYMKGTEWFLCALFFPFFIRHSLNKAKIVRNLTRQARNVKRQKQMIGVFVISDYNRAWWFVLFDCFVSFLVCLSYVITEVTSWTRIIRNAMHEDPEWRKFTNLSLFPHLLTARWSRQNIYFTCKA